MADIVDGNAYVDTDDITGGTDDATHGTGPGTDACKSLAYLMGTRVKTLTGALTVYCKGTAADTAAVTIGGHGATAIKSITIKTDAADRHDGKWNTSKYRLEVAAAYCITLNTEDYVTIDGLQLKSSTNGTWQQTGGVHCYVGSDSSTIKNNLIWTVINQNSI